MAQSLQSRGAKVDLLSHALSGPFPCDRHFELPLPRGGLSNKLRTLTGMLVSARLHAIATRFDFDAARQALGTERFDTVVVEDIYLLPLAFDYGNRVVMDAREYYPRVHESSLVFRLFQRPELAWLCREYLPRCDAVVTVSDGLAEEFAREFGVQAVVVRSTPDAQDIQVRPTNPDSVRMVHHGVANRDRKLENLIAIVERLDARFSLDLYLTGDATYIAELHKKQSVRTRILAPVPFIDICRTLNQYDIGLFYVEPTTFNLKHCMPNKLFEFIQARLAVAIGPSPDMAALVSAYACGVIAEEFTVASMASSLAKLDASAIDAMKHHSDAAAAELNFAIEGRKLEAVFG